MDVTTLFVVGPELTDYRIQDTLDALRWSCHGSYYVIFVENPNVSTIPVTDISDEAEARILRLGVRSDVAGGFLRANGAQWAVDRGITFRQLISMDIDCLPIGKGLDAWCLARLENTPTALVGVYDGTDCDAYRRCAAALSQWGVPYENWDTAPAALATPFLCFSSAFVDVLFGRGWLYPPDCYDWPASYGAFVSWTAKMMGYSILACGHVDQPHPPFYVAPSGGPRRHPSPLILSSEFKLYSSVRHVWWYGEEQVRHECALRRKGIGSARVVVW